MAAAFKIYSTTMFSELSIPPDPPCPPGQVSTSLSSGTLRDECLWLHLRCTDSHAKFQVAGICCYKITYVQNTGWTNCPGSLVGLTLILAAPFSACFCSNSWKVGLTQHHRSKSTQSIYPKGWPTLYYHSLRSAEALVDVVGRDDVRVSHVVGVVVGQVDLAQLRLRSLVVEAQLLVYRLRGREKCLFTYHSLLQGDQAAWSPCIL